MFIPLELTPLELTGDCVKPGEPNRIRGASRETSIRKQNVISVHLLLPYRLLSYMLADASLSSLTIANHASTGVGGKAQYT